jgi:hypothetical protein
MADFSTLWKNHEKLITSFAQGQKPISKDVRALIKEALGISPHITCLEDRQQLRYGLLFWASYISSLGEDLPDIDIDGPGRRPTKVEARRIIAPRNIPEKVRALVRPAAGLPEDYINSLQIGDFSGFWKEYTGAGQCVCLLDSGVDESHPALQGQIKAYAVFDAQGNYKEAKYSFDRTSHGTMCAGIIAGKSVARQNLGFSEPGAIRLGLAPDCKIVSVNVLQGDYRKEHGTLTQLLSGLNWAIENMDHPQFGGYRVVLIGLAVQTPWSEQVNRELDRVFDILRYLGLVPILASGQGTLGTRGHGHYVGACDRLGKPWKHNGKHVDVLAPGVDILCCQTPVPRLDQSYLGVNDGSSLAASMVAGMVVLLCQATRKDAHECLKALLETSRGRKVNLEDYRYLLENQIPFQGATERSRQSASDQPGKSRRVSKEKPIKGLPLSLTRRINPRVQSETIVKTDW